MSLNATSCHVLNGFSPGVGICVRFRVILGQLGVRGLGL